MQQQQLWWKAVRQSPSLRGRGLKWKNHKKHLLIICRPLYEGVDWNMLSRSTIGNIWCRPLYEGVDWNVTSTAWQYRKCCRPLYEGVDWNSFATKPHDQFMSPSLRGRGLKFYRHRSEETRRTVALFTRAWIEIWWVAENGKALSCRPLYEGVDWNWYTHRPRILWRLSPSLRGRGLKSIFFALLSADCAPSPSLRGRGLK